MREPKNQMLGTMEPPLMQLSVKVHFQFSVLVILIKTSCKELQKIKIK